MCNKTSCNSLQRSMWVWPMLIFWHRDVRRLTCAKNVWQFWWRFVCSSAAACSSWVYSIITNFSTRLVYGLQVRDHVTDATIELHWLPMHASINFKLCLLVHQALKSERPITELRCRAATVCHRKTPSSTCLSVTQKYWYIILITLGIWCYRWRT